MAITTDTIQFTSGSASLDAYLAHPDGTGPFPAVVVIHEIYGLNDNIKDIARRFANEGYIALAVDLFTGRNRTVCMMRFMSGLLLNSLNHQGIRDLKAALDTLVKLPGVDPDRLGAIGFCMGGGFAVAWSCADPRLKAIAPYYAVNPRPLEAVARACPVVGSYPDKDFTTGAGRKLDQTLTNHNIEHDIKIYPNSKHSFFNDQGAAHNPEASADSWQRVLTFFQKQIKDT